MEIVFLNPIQKKMFITKMSNIQYVLQMPNTFIFVINKVEKYKYELNTSDWKMIQV